MPASVDESKVPQSLPARKQNESASPALFRAAARYASPYTLDDPYKKRLTMGAVFCFMCLEFFPSVTKFFRTV
ncbi:MAG: hypothetical protein PVH24_05060, partial [Candidatus Zixiibacteriota bacterium]